MVENWHFTFLIEKWGPFSFWNYNSFNNSFAPVIVSLKSWHQFFSSISFKVYTCCGLVNNLAWSLKYFNDNSGFPGCFTFSEVLQALITHSPPFFDMSSKCAWDVMVACWGEISDQISQSTTSGFQSSFTLVTSLLSQRLFFPEVNTSEITTCSTSGKAFILVHQYNIQIISLVWKQFWLVAILHNCLKQTSH